MILRFGTSYLLALGVISDTAEYGCYLYNHACLPLLQDFMQNIDTDVIGRGLGERCNHVDNQTLM